MYYEISTAVKQASSLVWGPVLMMLLIGTGVYYTIRLRFPQVREFFHSLKIITGFFDHPRHKGEIKHFQALSTALSATIGTGNIAGVATAVALGGPGAVFWLWVTGVLGMAIKYSECVLAVKYRVFTKEGVVAGGPMYYLEKGMKAKPLAVLFSVCAIVTSMFIGNMVQSNSVADVLNSSLKIPHLVTGVFMAVLAWLVIIGGVKRIAAFAQFVVPFMCVVYVTGALFVVLTNAGKVIPAIGLIIRCAFTPAAATGAFAGSAVLYTMRMGIARGLFSNEAGLGSAPIAHAAVRENEPVREGLVGLMEPFIDTVVICTLTALAIVVSGMWSSGLNGASLTAAAFKTAIPGWGDLIVGLSLAFFAGTTIIGWSYYGDRCVYYLFGEKGIRTYSWVYCLLIPVGAVVKLEIIWNMADIANAFMAFPNLVALLALSGVVVRQTASYNGKLRMARKLHRHRK